MADDLPDLTAKLRLDTSTLDAGVSKAVGVGSAIGSAIGMLGANLVMAGLDKVGDFLTGSIQAARESAEIGKATTAILEATGGAAGVTADQVSGLATSLSNATGMDDELIQTGENLLLTFRNVKNAGAGADAIFDRATGAALDLSKAGFGSVESASTMLGKALNDPIAGMTALGRAGVTFSDEQKEHIKGFVESGNLLGAQRTILDEVANQVGGVAAATADPMARAQVAMGNFQEQVGGFLLPILGDLATFAVDTLLPALQTAFGWFGENVLPMVEEIGTGILPILQTIGGALAGLFSGDAAAGASGFMGTIQEVVLFLTVEFLPRLQEVWERIAAFGSGMAERLAPMLPAVQGAFETIGSIIITVLDIITTAWDNWGEGLMNVAGAAFSAILGIIGPVLSVIQAIVQTVLAAISGDWSGAWQGVQNILRGAMDLVVGIATGALGILSAMFSGVLAKIEAWFDQTWDNIVRSVAGAWANMVGTVSVGVANVVAWVSAMPGRIQGAISGLAGMLFNAAWSAFSNFLSGVQSAAGGIFSFVGSIPGRIVGLVSSGVGSLFNSGWSMIQSLAQGITSGFQAAIGAVSSGMATIRSYMPFSPAKRGPFSGTGYPLYSGRAIGESFGQGITDSMGLAVNAARSLSAATSSALTGSGTFDASATGSGSNGAGGAGTGAPVHVRVFIGDRELTDIVSVQVDQGFDQLAGSLERGSA